MVQRLEAGAPARALGGRPFQKPKHDVDSSGARLDSLTRTREPTRPCARTPRFSRRTRRAPAPMSEPRVVTICATACAQRGTHAHRTRIARPCRALRAREPRTCPAGRLRSRLTTSRPRRAMRRSPPQARRPRYRSLPAATSDAGRCLISDSGGFSRLPPTLPASECDARHFRDRGTPVAARPRQYVGRTRALENHQARHARLTKPVERRRATSCHGSGALHIAGLLCDAY